MFAYYQDFSAMLRARLYGGPFLRAIGSVFVPEHPKTLDYSKYTNQELLNSLDFINRSKYEHNYVACEREVERRKASGEWQVEQATAERKSVERSRKTLKIFALVQVVGSLAGIGSYLFPWVQSLFTNRPGDVSLWNFFLGLPLFSFGAWAAWRYWRSGKDQRGWWRISLFLQTPNLVLGSFAYQYYAGVVVPVGIGPEGFFGKAGLGASFVVLWGARGGFLVAVNVIALVMLVLLARVAAFDARTAEDRRS